jgi:hypothetical protein
MSQWHFTFNIPVPYPCLVNISKNDVIYFTQFTYINEIFNTGASENSVIHSALMTCWLCAPHSITLPAGLGWQLNCKCFQNGHQKPQFEEG